MIRILFICHGSILKSPGKARISIEYSTATLADHKEEYLGVPQGGYAKDGETN